MVQALIKKGYKMFITVTVTAQGTKRLVDIVATKVFGVSRSEMLNSSIILSDTGHAISVEETVENVKEQLKQVLTK